MGLHLHVCRGLYLFMDRVNTNTYYMRQYGEYYSGC
jgi:hypothetical protein